MKRIILFIFMITSLAISSIPAIAAKKASFGTFPIPLMVIDENRGVFIDLAKEIAKRVDLEIRISVAPPKRTINRFMGNEIDVIFPALDVFFPPGKELLKSTELIYIKKDFIFTKKGGPILKSVTDLEGKKVGITLGYPYAREIIENKNIRKDAAKTDESNVKKLMVGRIQAFVAEEKSGLKAFENTGNQNNFQYDSKTPVSEQNVYFAFQNNDKGRSLAKMVTQALTKMKNDGTFGRIMAAAQ